ncbi:PD40 domain-containing protein [Campylobacter canadensis]|uniref:PD40 domain-containing protein n=1 Tax=Campylobacter canadensis TaxID=449520 RepID=A0ABS7WRK0_9BACT|nr:PD40 domain-containing protein [Campylobacter canadensis]MBZ7987359.1 PD40 domain-containing protein [Campylobacter canadensis]MBZ7994758.1 PD40 domain-containing protein [Campylobacter canadensis]MBZ7996534.1 PD40 domain-containing protein [Campylobacter canadensis]MBZ7998470.1 PD40 domain-containing protein [Campylobacter canadensis]MBZ8000184.1 PD40 domain-containing protein [Campylobacter canadensis]
MKKFLLVFLLNSFLFADLIMDVVGEQEVLPKIQILTNTQANAEFDNILRNDVLVSAIFDISTDSNADYFLYYSLKDSDDKYDLELTLKDAKLQTKYYTKLKYPKDMYAFLSHKAISNMVKELNLTNVDWMNKKILLTRKVAAKQSQIVLADYTLSYQKVILQGGLNLFAKWADDEEKAFYYSDYSQDELKIYKYNIANNTKNLIVSGNGMLALSDVKADKALITMTNSDQPDVFLFDLNTKNAKRLTSYKGIDVGAKFIGDNSFVFISDRSSYPNIYMQALNSNNASQLVYHGKNNSAFDVFNEYVVYSSRESEGDFNLYLMSVNNQFVRQLTLNGRNIFPIFSKDGETIMFIKLLGNQSSLGILRLKENKVFHFPLKIGKISTLDW